MPSSSSTLLNNLSLGNDTGLTTSATTVTTTAVSVGANSNSQSNALQTNTHVLSAESIRCIGETIGIANLNDEACRDLINELTFTVRTLIDDAKKFMRKSKRRKLVLSDLDLSLKLRGFEPIYGFTLPDLPPIRSTSGAGNATTSKTIFFADDSIIDLNQIVTTNNQSLKIPNDFVLNAHWLAIEGVQPSIPENPQIVKVDYAKSLADSQTNKSKSKTQLNETNAAKKQAKQDMGYKVKPILPHDLSLEQQIYFKEITEACVGNDETKRSEALNSLTNDPGLHQLLPRFILFISEGVRLNIHQLNMVILIYLMRMTKAIVENKAIYLEKYLHELIPSILSCVLCKRVCMRPEIDNHSALREFGARIIGQLVSSYISTIPSLQTRLVKVYVKAIQHEESSGASGTPLSTLFGALAGLAEFGDQIVETVVFPLVKSIGTRLVQLIDSENVSEKQPAEKIREQVIEICTNVLKEKSSFVPNDASSEFDYLTSKFGAYFGQLIHERLNEIRSERKQRQIHSVNMAASNAKSITISSHQN